MGLRFERCVLDEDRLELRRDGDVVALEPRALRTLQQLLDGRGRVVTKHELLDSVWGDRFVSESALTTQIKALRRALGDTGRDQAIIKTVHGVGYRFVPPVRETEPGPTNRDSDGTARRARDAVGEIGGSGARAETSRSDGEDGRELAPRDNPVVAVLPFENLARDRSMEHLADGLTSDVVTALSKHRWLRVLPRSTSSGYAEHSDAVARLRDELGVHYAIEGTFRVTHGRLRISVNLIDAVTGECRWAERYQRDFSDVFDVLDDISDLIVANVEPMVGHAERNRVSRRPRTDLEAWELYHLGVAHFFRFTAQDNLEAQRLLDRARRMDPGFPDAQAWWAYAVVLGMTYWDTEPDGATLDDALAATTRALTIDDHDAVLHMLRGRVLLARCEYDAALVESQRAVELNETLASAFCGLGDALCYTGRYDEAIAHFERAVDLGSHDPQRWAFLSYGALALLLAERYDEAIEWTERASAIPHCQYWAIAHRIVAMAHLGRAEECAGDVATLRREWPPFTVSYAQQKLFFIARPEQRHRYLSGLRDAGVPEGRHVRRHPPNSGSH
jgi:TolB-like protein/DNA-binding winged helix-turn-helix (wHTH) protein